MSRSFSFIDGNEPLSKAGAYLLRHVSSGKCYVGISGNVKRRISDHQCASGRTKLHHAIREHGAMEFQAIPLFYVTTSDTDLNQYLVRIEESLIKEFAAAKHGFNATEKSLGYRHSFDEAFGRKIALGRKLSGAGVGSRNPNFGKPMSPETKAKLSLAKTGKNTGASHYLFGKSLPVEVRERISKSRIGKYGGKNNPMYGTTHSAGTRAKISASLVGMFAGDNHPMRQERNRRTCAHCGKTMAMNTFSRWHGDRCKEIRS